MHAISQFLRSSHITIPQILGKVTTKNQVILGQCFGISLEYRLTLFTISFEYRFG